MPSFAAESDGDGSEEKKMVLYSVWSGNDWLELVKKQDTMRMCSLSSKQMGIPEVCSSTNHLQ